MSISEKIYNELKASLLAGRLNPAPLILEHDIAAQYQVSKTPAREALNRLADEGILIKYPRKGYVLNKLTDKQFQMLLETRYMLLESYVEVIFDRNSDEDLVAFAKNATDYEADASKHIGPNTHFYLQLAALTKNPWVLQITENLLMHFFCCSDNVFRYHIDASAEMRQNHQQIIDALLVRNADAVRAALKHDIMKV
ncbi:GntR family transcriptional regulator [Ihubacter sp. mB4P-1]|uniref:GntR family transcriptional regulator n=1 Tax=Ihubacter sp. mB4P-1 TaxID=3242370 RepID=UPI00137AB4FB